MQTSRYIFSRWHPLPRQTKTINCAFKDRTRPGFSGHNLHVMEIPPRESLTFRHLLRHQQYHHPTPQKIGLSSTIKHVANIAQAACLTPNCTSNLPQIGATGSCSKGEVAIYTCAGGCGGCSLRGCYAGCSCCRRCCLAATNSSLCSGNAPCCSTGS